MTYDSVLINGDSYSASNNMSSWTDHMGNILSKPVTNIAVLGNNNDSICRNTVEHVEYLLPRGHRPLVIVGWSFVRRKEVFYHGNDEGILQKSANRFVTLDWLINLNLATPEQKYSIEPDSDVHKQLMDWYTNMFFLANYLHSKNLVYRFFSAADNTDCDIDCFPDLRHTNLVKNVRQDPWIYSLHDFCVRNWARKNDPQASDTGHLSDTGSKEFAHWICRTLEI